MGENRRAVVRLPAPSLATHGRVKTADGGLFTEPKRVVVGIDQSLVAFGLCTYAWEDDTYFAWLFTPSGHGVRRLWNIQQFLNRTLLEVTSRCGVIEHICMEGYAYGSPANREMMGECGAATKLALLEHSGAGDQLSYPTVVAPPMLKKYVTGSGNAKKNQMLLAVHRKWDVTFSDDNMADAYALARVAAALVTGDTKFDYEADVIRRIARHTEWELPSRTLSRSSGKAKRASSG